MSIQDPYDRSYEKSATGVISTLASTAEQGANHIAYQEPGRPEYVSLPDKLRGLAADLTLAVNQGKITLIDTLMAEGVQALRLNSQHAIGLSIYHNNPSLLDIGIPMKAKPVAKSKVSLLDIEPDLSAKYLLAGRDIVTSAALLLIKRPANNAVVEVMMTQTPSDEASWAKVGEGMYNQSRIELRGLESMKKFYFRARYHEKGATGHWCAPVCIIIH